jgi:hypothetical protein
METIYLIISLVCLLAGALFLVLAIFLPESSRREYRGMGATGNARSGGGNAQHESSWSGDALPLSSTDTYADGYSADDDTDRLELFSEDLDLNLDDFDVAGPAVKGESGVIDGRSDTSGFGGGIEFESVFFEDSSSLIDYGRESGTIDPSFKEYKKISRVGSGVLKAEKDNLNFHTGRKVYHYDFKKISDLKTGKNFIAAKIQGSTIVKLFIIQSNTHQIRDVSDKYRAFLAG